MASNDPYQQQSTWGFLPEAYPITLEPERHYKPVGLINLNILGIPVEFFPNPQTNNETTNT